MITPLHFLEVKLGKRPQPVKTRQGRGAEERLQEKNKVAAAPCQNKNEEQKAFLKQESEWLELMNAELKTQMEELKQEWQQLILMLNQHHPTYIIRTDSVKTPSSRRQPTAGAAGEEVSMGREEKAGQRLWARETPNQAAVGTSLASLPGHPPKGPLSARKSHEFPDPDPDPDARLEKGTVSGPGVPTHCGPAQSYPEWQLGRTLAGTAGVAVGTRHGHPSKAHTP
ncbi:LOW QUALITY PROTEIN: hypothetical protein QTO34_015870 [Cnephaeus nilssonii]|uniref:BZIP domain-containing protein n=1 Tax=Cnephaeus nilssonii TaxID=3371016 RepID=A0AA40LTB7_CNENI|nr:LOW QUALITY PROTEIN: hypothetical protein QTO34_015870 [Eptesicus nilssonii]